MTKLLVTTKNFYAYQKERFPIIILGLSLLPAILSSGAIVTQPVTIKFILLALVVSIGYLLHVRIIDEFRDYKHDLKHHKERPLSIGSITLNELHIIDWITIVLVIAAAAYASKQALLVVVLMLTYSFFARNEFFLGLKFRRHFYLYNAANLVQMFLLQILIYVLASEALLLTTIILVHFLFTSIGTIIFEFLRKVKMPGQDGTGQDTYTWFLGLNDALLVYAIFAILNILLFVKIMLLTQDTVSYWLPITSLFVAGTFGTLLINKLQKTDRTNQLMQLSFMVMYGAFNILIFLAA